MAIICSNCGGSNYDENDVCLDCGFFVNGLPAGTLLDNRYEILEALKAGGMGAVYLAFDTRLHQHCAVKEMFNTSSGQSGQKDYIIKRFMEEAKLLAGLNHPSIPRVIDYFNTGEDKYYLVMDYIKGRDLYSYIFESGEKGLSEELVLDWALQVCDVLDYLHTQPRPILHRDLKPSNLILRDSDSRIMLIDFGLARNVNLQSHTQKTVVGTMGYAPMEQYQGHPEPRSDIYSLGATMHFLLVAEESMPFKFPPVRELRPNISPWMERVIQKSLSLKPENRFSSAEEMYRVLSGELSIDDLIFNPDDVDGFDMTPAPSIKEKPSAARGLKASVAVSRPADDPYTGLDSKKIITMAKGARDRRIVEPLINILLHDPYDENRRSAATSLGEFGDDRAVEPLIQSLKGEEQEHVLTHVAWALGKLGDTKATEALFEFYEKDVSKKVKDSIKSALVEIGSRRQNGEIVRFLFNLIDEDFTEYAHILPDDSSLYFPSLKNLLIETIRDYDRVTVQFHLGLIYYSKGQKNYSLNHFEKAHRWMKEKKHPGALLFIGKIYQEKRELDRAIEHFELAMKLDSSCKETYDLLINAYYDLAREDAKRCLFDEELKGYNKIIDDFPDHIDTPFFCGLVAIKQKNNKEALKYFTEYLEHGSRRYVQEAQEYIKDLQQNIFVKIFSTIKELFKKKDTPEPVKKTRDKRKR